MAKRNNIQLKSLQIPILVIGTKADMVDDAQRLKQLNRGGNIGRCYAIQNYSNQSNKFICIFICLTAEQCGADLICLNCHDSRSLAAGTTDAVKLSRFFDKVIERKYYPRGETYGNDKRKYTQFNASPPFTSTYKTTSENVI